MHKLVTLSDQIIAGEREIKYASYLVDDQVIDITFTHSPTWEISELSKMEWDEFKSRFPLYSQLPPISGKGLLNWESGQWISRS